MEEDLFKFCDFEMRWKINNHIMQNLQNDEIIKQNEYIEEYKRYSEMISQYDSELSQKLFNDADIIAMTTTCRAKYNYLLKNIKMPIVIVEEAAEVLEAHTLASINQHTQHLILIGDH